MERLLLSKEMGVSSSRIHSGNSCQEGVNYEGDKSFGVDAHTSGQGSTTNTSSEAMDVPTTPCHSTCDSRPELGLPNMCEADLGYSPLLDRGNRWGLKPTWAPAFPLEPNQEFPAVPNADNGGSATAGISERIYAAQVAQVPEALSINQETVEHGGVQDGTGNECGIVAEDWLDAAHALLDAFVDPSCT